MHLPQSRAVNRHQKLKIYELNETNFANNGLGILHDADQVKVTTKLDGERMLEFVLPYKTRTWKLLKHFRIIKCDDQYYRIVNYNRKNSGTEPSTITCYHVFSDISGVTVPYLKETNDTPYNILSKLISEADTPITVLSPQEVAYLGMKWVESDVHLAEQGETNVGDILSQIVSSLEKVELYVDNWNIALVERVGSNKGIKLDETVNAEDIEEETDSTELINRIFVMGKDGMQLDEKLYPTGYYESKESIDIYGVREGYLTFDDIDDPTLLLSAVQWACSPSNPKRVDAPKSAITFTYLDISKYYKNFPSLSIGDTVQVPTHLTIDHLAETRITQLVYYPLTPDNSTITVGEPPKKLTDLLTATIIAGGKLDKITDETGKLKLGWFQAIKATYRTTIQGLMKKMTVVEHATADVWTDPDNPDVATFISGGHFAIANGKTVDGDWNWNSFITSTSSLQDQVFAAQINTGVCKIQDDDGLMRIFARRLEMYRGVSSEGEGVTPAIFMGRDEKTGEFEFKLFDVKGKPVFYADEEGNLHIKAQLEAGSVLSEDLSMELGDVTDLTVNRVRTSDFASRYLLKNQTNFVYQLLQGGRINYYKAILTSTTPVQMKTTYDEPLYWKKDPNADGNTIDEYGDLYDKDGSRIMMTTTNTKFPVNQYTYSHQLALRLGVSDTGLPSIELGDNLPINSSNSRLLIEPWNAGGKITWVDNTGNEFGIGFNAQGVHLINAGSLVADIRTAHTEPFRLHVTQTDPINPKVGQMWLIDTP